MLLASVPVHSPLSQFRGCSDVVSSTAACVEARCSIWNNSSSRAAGVDARLPSSMQSRLPPAAGRSRTLVVSASSSSSSSSSRDAGLPGREAAERRRVLLKYVREVQPALVEQFVESGPPAVVSAMKNTITNMLGTLPPQFFTVTISTVGENMSQLMLSVMMTGYLFRNAQYRLELRNALGDAASMRNSSSSSSSSAASLQPSSSAGKSTSSALLQRSQSAPAQGSVLDEEAYAPGVQKSRVQGDVLLWHKENGLETLEAVQYIELLEGEVARLRQQLTQMDTQPSLPAAQQQSLALQQPQQPGSPGQADGRQLPVPVSSTSSSLQQQAGSSVAAGHSSGPAGLLLLHEESTNELLEYLRTLDAASLSDLTSCADTEVAQAMESFVGRLMGTTDRDSLSRAGSDCTAQELAKVMFWLMIVGYTLRGLEVRWDMQKAVLTADRSKAGDARLSCDNSADCW